MQNKPFTRIDNRLVMDEKEPNIKEWIGKSLDDYEKEYSSWKHRPSYPINPADLDKFEFGKQYWEGKDFFKGCGADECDCRFAGNCKKVVIYKQRPTAFPLPTPNDRREEKQKEESDWRVWRELFDELIEAVNKTTPYQAYQILRLKYKVSKNESNTPEIKATDLIFRKKAHFTMATHYEDQLKDDNTNIWEITTTVRTRDGIPTKNIKTVYYIGDEKKKYKTLEEVVTAYNNKTPKP